MHASKIEPPTRLELVPLHCDFGVAVRGVNVGVDLADEAFAQIERTAEQYSVVVLRDQTLDDDRQLAFSRRFGALEFCHVAYGRDGRIEYLGTVGNIDAQGKRMGLSHEQVVFGTGNYLWHSDSSFRDVPTRFSISYAYEVPPSGGDLEFTSTRAAYARLPDEMRDGLDDLVVIHDYVFSRSKVATVDASHAASLPPVRQRLVRTNPVTGERNYHVGSHARSIEGWPEEEARALLDELLERATAPECVYRHRWQVGDLVIWDNRCVLHRGSPYDADRYRRRMRQARVAGTGNSLVAG